MSLEEITNRIHAKFDAQNKVRDRIMGEIRKVLKWTREAIAAIHRNELKTAETTIDRSRDVLAEVRIELGKFPTLPVTGLIHNAEGEVAEAKLLLAFRKEETLPGPEHIGVDDIGYLLGLGDLVGELRRVTIDALKNSSLDLAERAFTQMDEIYNLLLTFDFPRALTPGIRQKTDVARGLVERTRADISTEIQRRRLIESIEQLQKSLNNR